MRWIRFAGILTLFLSAISAHVGAQEPPRVSVCFESAEEVFLEFRRGSWTGTPDTDVTQGVAPTCRNFLLGEIYHVRAIRTGYRGWEQTFEVMPDMRPIHITMEPDPRYETVIATGAMSGQVRAGFGGFVIHMPDRSWAIYHLDTATLEPLDDSPYVLYPRLPEKQLLALDVARLPPGGYETVYSSPSGRQVAFPRTGPDGLHLWVINLNSMMLVDTGIIVNSDATYGGFPASAVFWLSEVSFVVQADDQPDYSNLPYATLVTLQGDSVLVAPLFDVEPWAEARRIWPEIGEVSRILAVSPSGRQILAWTFFPLGRCLLWNADTGTFRILGSTVAPAAAWYMDYVYYLRSNCGARLTEYIGDQYWGMLLDPYELDEPFVRVEAFAQDGSAVAVFRAALGDITGSSLLMRRLPYD